MSEQPQLTEQPPVAVTLIGLGDMGSALARAFLANRHRVTVWNRTAAKATPLVQAGAQQAKSVEDAAAASDVIVVCVLDYAVSENLLTPPAVAEKLRGKTLVQLTSGTPRLAREAEAWAQNNHISYLDGAIIGYPSSVGTADCTILYAGLQKVFEAHKQLLGYLGPNSMFLGERIGSASALDSSLLTFGFTAELGFCHGAALCEAEGIPIDSYREAANALKALLVRCLLWRCSSFRIPSLSLTVRLAKEHSPWQLRRIKRTSKCVRRHCSNGQLWGRKHDSDVSATQEGQLA